MDKSGSSLLGVLSLAAIIISPSTWSNSSVLAHPRRVRAVLVSQNQSRSIQAMSIKNSIFGRNKQGQEVHLYTLTNSHGLVAKLIDYGATLVSMETPDRTGKMANITLGFPTLERYLERHPYFGSTVGRYGNRIANGRFSIDGKNFDLAKNNGPNHLHGGIHGFDSRMWKAKEWQTANAVGVSFELVSPDGDEGYPGTLNCTVKYSLTENDELKIEYSATSDKTTVVNLTNHAYWNLGGAGSGQILAHELEIAADKYLPIDDTSIPTGQLADVKGTAMDFTSPHTLGERISVLKEPPHKTQGYDHCYVLRGQKGTLEFAARAYDPKSGRVMEVYTTEPGVQLYCGNFLDRGEGAGGFGQHDALCLETQHYPDSPNQRQFPTTRLDAGQTFRSTTVHKFSLKK